MPRIAWINEPDATGELAELYRYWLERNPERPGIPGILKCFSQSTELFRSILDLSYRVHFSDGHLDRRLKELIATWVSALNQCPY
jgi:alkylhydroperoxidase family enzyme